MKNPQSALVTILNRDIMTPEMFDKARAEHAALVAVAEAAENFRQQRDVELSSATTDNNAPRELKNKTASCAIALDAAIEHLAAVRNQ